MEIRRSTDAADMAHIQNMAHDWIQKLELNGGIDWGHMVAQTQGILSLGGYFALAWDGEDCIGGMLGILGPGAFSGLPEAHEIAWYVDPSHRGASAGSALVRDFESWAGEQGAGEVHMTQMLASSPELVAQFYRSQGYEPLETKWRKVI